MYQRCLSDQQSRNQYDRYYGMFHRLLIFNQVFVLIVLYSNYRSPRIKTEGG